MSWFSVGYEEAEKMSVPRTSRSNRNFWTKPDETAVVRFLQREPFNYKRAFIPSARGAKYFTSPMVEPDPFVTAGYNLQGTFAYKILDRRILEFTDRNGENQKVGPRVLYFAVGQRDRKALRAFEAQMLADYNEGRVEEDKPTVSIDEYNITSYDIKVTKPSKGAWQFLAVRGGRPVAPSSEDRELLEKNEFDLADELKPLPIEEIRQILNVSTPPSAPVSEPSAQYSYDTEPAEEPTFFGR